MDTENGLTTPELLEYRKERRQQCYDNMKDFNEMMHTHLIDTTDKFVGYGQIAAEEFRKTVDLLHDNCMDYTDKLSEVVKDNKDVILPIAKEATKVAIVGIACGTMFLVANSLGYKEKYNLKKGKVKITNR